MLAALVGSGPLEPGLYGGPALVRNDPRIASHGWTPAPSSQLWRLAPAKVSDTAAVPVRVSG